MEALLTIAGWRIRDNAEAGARLLWEKCLTSPQAVQQGSGKFARGSVQLMGEFEKLGTCGVEVSWRCASTRLSPPSGLGC